MTLGTENSLISDAQKRGNVHYGYLTEKEWVV